MNHIFESYTLEQWILLFFFYSFCGYLWEVFYVSLRKHHLTDRGFLYGPILPIYGSGALIILLATIPVKYSVPLVFICGLLAATLLEFITGWAMEKLFKVRYWDYSDDFLNVGGYICLKASLAWGVFSVLLIHFVQDYVEKILFMIPAEIVTPCAFVLTAAFCVDATVSVRAALDLKEVLQNIAANNEELRRLQNRLDVVAAFIEEDKENLKERVSDSLESIGDKLEVLQNIAANNEELRRLQNRLDVVAAFIEEDKENLKERVSDSLESISDKLEDLGEKVEDFKLEQSYIRSQRKIVRRQNIEQAKADYRLRFEQLAENLKAQEKYFAEHAQDTAENLQERVKKQSELSNIRTAMTEFNAKRRIERQQKSYRHAQSILKRNGSAISKKYADALNELKQTKDKNAKTSE